MLLGRFIINKMVVEETAISTLTMVDSCFQILEIQGLLKVSSVHIKSLINEDIENLLLIRV